jgi:hypothetical protein
MQQGGYVYSGNNVQPGGSELVQVNKSPNQMNNQTGNPMNNHQMYHQNNPQAGYQMNNNMQPNNHIAMGGGQPQTVMVVHNQVPVTSPLNVKLLSLALFCGRCNMTVNSRVEKQCSCANLCCCCWFTPIIWLCFQCCRNKEISCNNATHYCPNCSTPIGQYEAC